MRACSRPYLQPPKSSTYATGERILESRVCKMRDLADPRITTSSVCCFLDYIFGFVDSDVLSVLFPNPHDVVLSAVLSVA